MNVLGHCTGRLVTGSRGQRPQSEFDAAAVFEACAENDVAVEINSRRSARTRRTKLIRLALEAGCLFSIDSDAHAPARLDFKALGCERAERLGVPGRARHQHVGGRPSRRLGTPQLRALTPPSSSMSY